MDRASPPVMSPPEVKPGTVIGGKYRIERELGRGAFGVVLRAVHLALGEPVALKVLTDVGGPPEAWAEDAARFRREAKATAALRSDHVVRILDVDVLDNGFPYIVMEYLEGATLHTVVHTRGPLGVHEAVDYILEVLAALAEAHAAGIVHRDLKPANVFLTTGRHGINTVKVLDFGVSKAGTADDHQITRTGAVIGTASYMSPEQMLDAKRVDARTDLWAVGVILYELLTKKLPFEGNMAAIVQLAPTPIHAVRPGLPPVLVAAITRCLERNPDRRFSTAGEVGLALAELGTPRSQAAVDSLRRAGKPTGAAAPFVRPARRRTKRRRWVVPAIGLSVGVLLGALGGLMVLRRLAPRGAHGGATTEPRASASASAAPSTAIPRRPPRP